MPSITYVLPDGTESTVEVPIGQTVMDGSVRNNLPGIVAECGGGCSCATCHVHLDEKWSGLFDAPSDEEAELLECTDDYCSQSRLSCQLVVTAGCDGMRLSVPEGN
ncbi:2Fe-2S iron-sulfur cluster-binding protein [Mycobacterium sp. AT1]|uniref:2Fe-2S iron-sulfur cluster-binding protein n=1 Tax=Mycobacterium sp. AT1 TaxID=1961706 RepID=UPI0009AF1E50|nr:2Fe-2S iron-sulfur cluster-binding protein [Mycobacterium sp. AT1]OPX10655.1 (2Fe-2S)-binding protein [Mycobacterium sp. AT1]